MTLCYSVFDTTTTASYDISLHMSRHMSPQISMTWDMKNPCRAALLTSNTILSVHFD